MKKIFITMITVGFLLTPLIVYAQSNQMPTGTPPVAQSLVPEGDFALKLVTALKLGTPISEAQSEDMLTSVGIAPRNGWIADYPVTPDIIGELQNAVVTAADSKKLPLGKDEALKAFQGLTAEFGLAVLPGSSGKYAESPPQPNPTVINNYYYEEGPPVVTYYPPPWDYDYLYGWVPYPFWYSGFFFPGFFVLNDFDMIVVGHHHHQHRITNHFFDPKTHMVIRLDPVSHAPTHVLHATAFNSTSTKNAASSIFNHSLQRTTLGQGTQGSTNNHISMPSGIQGKKGVITNNSANTMGSKTFSSSKSFVNSGGMNHRSTQSSIGSFGGSHVGGSHSISGFSGGGGCRGRC